VITELCFRGHANGFRLLEREAPGFLIEEIIRYGCQLIVDGENSRDEKID
jgi:hypothetical protein